MSRSRMLELLEPRQLLSADVLESSLVVDQPVLSMPALSVDAGKLERFAADDMLLIRTDARDHGSGLVNDCLSPGDERKEVFLIYLEVQTPVGKLVFKVGAGKQERKSPATQPTTQPSDLLERFWSEG